MRIQGGKDNGRKANRDGPDDGGQEKAQQLHAGEQEEYFFGYPTEGKDGYSDCSSAVRKAIERVTGISIGSNTVAQVNNNKTLQWVEFANGNKYPTIELCPGDLLYFKGTDSSRPYKVGHVEMVAEDTTNLLGHGSGTGPREIDLKEYCASRYRSGKGLIGVKRVVLEGEAPEQTVSSLGKRIRNCDRPTCREKTCGSCRGCSRNWGRTATESTGTMGRTRGMR